MDKDADVPYSHEAALNPGFLVNMSFLFRNPYSAMDPIRNPPKISQIIRPHHIASRFNVDVYQKTTTSRMFLIKVEYIDRSAM